MDRPAAPTRSAPAPARAEWRDIVACYQTPSVRAERHAAFGDPARSFRGVRGDALRHARELRAGARAFRRRRRLPGPDLHHHARLRPRLVLPLPAGQRPGRLRDRRPDAHALRPVGRRTTRSTTPRPGTCRSAGTAMSRRSPSTSTSPSARSAGSSTAFTATRPCCSCSGRSGWSSSSASTREAPRAGARSSACTSPTRPSS